MLSTEVIRIALGTALLVSLYKYVAEEKSFTDDPWFMPVIFVLLWVTLKNDA
jgi:hypothetical protein